MSDAIAVILGAAIGAIATIGGGLLQTVLRSRADAERRQEAHESEREQRRATLAQRYLFQLQDALGRALAAERILSLEGVPAAMDGQFPGLGP
jgi:hypothetical protein